MTWILDEQQRMLRDSAQAFMSERMPVAHLRALRDADDPRGYDPLRWKEFASQGYCGVLVPELHGGLGLGVVEAGLVAEQIGHTLAPTPFFSTAVLAAWLLREKSELPLAQAWLPRLSSGEVVVALAVDEGGRHRPDRLATRAVREGDGWKVNGAKSFVIDGHVADAWIVAVRAETGTVLLLVPRDTPGVTVERSGMVDAHNAARLRLDNVWIDNSLCIAAPAEGAAWLDRVLDVGRAVAAAELLGLADEVFARTTRYLKQRKQFGKLIGEFQALQHRAAELYCDLELTRALVRQALLTIDLQRDDAALRAAQAKARACLTANRAVQEGVQMHGGIGMTDDLDLGLFMKRARVLQELFGDASFQLNRGAQLAGY